MTGRATMWTRRRGRVQIRWRTEEREHLGNLIKIESNRKENQKGSTDKLINPSGG